MSALAWYKGPYRAHSSTNILEMHLDANAQLPVFVPGLLAMLSAVPLVGGLGASLSHSQVLPSIAGTQGVESHRAVAGAAADDSPFAGAAADSAWHPHPVCADVVHALVGVAHIAGDDAQLWLPQSVHLLHYVVVLVKFCYTNQPSLLPFQHT